MRKKYRKELFDLRIEVCSLQNALNHPYPGSLPWVGRVMMPPPHPQTMRDDLDDIIRGLLRVRDYGGAATGIVNAVLAEHEKTRDRKHPDGGAWVKDR
jgi:hypothetical protein